MSFLDFVRGELSDFIDAKIEHDKERSEYCEKTASCTRSDWFYDGRFAIKRLEDAELNLALALEKACKSN